MINEHRTDGAIQETGERAYLVAVRLDEDDDMWSVEDSLDELASLAETAGAQVVGRMIQHLHHPDSATYLGKGRAQELSDLEKQMNFGLVICDDELSPSQQRNLEGMLEHGRVLDRTALILDIFAQHAHTREGRLQVELAQLEYRLPRLVGRGGNFSRIGGGVRGGGAIGVRGPGETRLERDRRHIRSRIAEIREEIEAVREQRGRLREQRTAQSFPRIALVGYTNAGKSTLFNALTASSVIAENKLFATLDPTTHRLILPHHEEALLTDTVGFLQKLPTELVVAFRATLEEVTEADLLIDVVDISHQNAIEQSETVNEVLTNLGARDIPRVTALNKVDVLDDPSTVDLSLFPNAVAVSALKHSGLEALGDTIVRVLAEQMEDITVCVPYANSELVDLFHRRGILTQEEPQEAGTLLVGRLPKSLQGYYRPYVSV